MVRAKFYVQNISDSVYNLGDGKSQQTISLSPVYGEGNKSWSLWTPSGKIEMTITNKEAIDQLKLGQCYYVDFSPAPLKEEGEK